MTIAGSTQMHVLARATTGQHLDIRYDPQTHTIVFTEDDWSADGLSGVTPRMAFREPMEGPRVRKLRRRAA